MHISVICFKKSSKAKKNYLEKYKIVHFSKKNPARIVMQTIFKLVAIKQPPVSPPRMKVMCMHEKVKSNDLNLLHN